MPAVERPSSGRFEWVGEGGGVNDKDSIKLASRKTADPQIGLGVARNHDFAIDQQDLLLERKRERNIDFVALLFTRKMNT